MTAPVTVTKHKKHKTKAPPLRLLRLRSGDDQERYKMKPAWYLTPTEYASIIVDAVEACGYFGRNDKAHPEDLEIAFDVVSKTVALSIAHVAANIYNGIPADHVSGQGYS